LLACASYSAHSFELTPEQVNGVYQLAQPERSAAGPTQQLTIEYGEMNGQTVLVTASCPKCPAAGYRLLETETKELGRPVFFNSSGIYVMAYDANTFVSVMADGQLGKKIWQTLVYANVYSKQGTPTIDLATAKEFVINESKRLMTGEGIAESVVTGGNGTYYAAMKHGIGSEAYDQMEVLICWISKVPNVVWSAIIASLLTFLGVLWTNKGNEKRQAAILSHEEKKFKSEQKIALKRDVFLEAAGSFANAIGIIPKLMNINFTEKDIEEQLKGHAAIVAKTYLSASESSISEILNFSSELAEAILGLSKPRQEILGHKKAIDVYQKIIDDSNKEKDRIISIMKEFNIQGRKDDATFNYLNASYETQEKIISENQEHLDNQSRVITTKYKEFCKNCIAENSRILLLLPTMTIALRKELENDENSQIFINAIEESARRMKTSFEQLLD